MNKDVFKSDNMKSFTILIVFANTFWGKSDRSEIRFKNSDRN